MPDSLDSELADILGDGPEVIEEVVKQKKPDLDSLLDDVLEQTDTGKQHLEQQAEALKQVAGLDNLLNSVENVTEDAGITIESVSTKVDTATFERADELTRNIEADDSISDKDKAKIQELFDQYRTEEDIEAKEKIIEEANELYEKALQERADLLAKQKEKAVEDGAEIEEEGHFDILQEHAATTKGNWITNDVASYDLEENVDQKAIIRENWNSKVRELIQLKADEDPSVNPDVSDEDLDTFFEIVRDARKSDEGQAVAQRVRYAQKGLVTASFGTAEDWNTFKRAFENRNYEEIDEVLNEIIERNPELAAIKEITEAWDAADKRMEAYRSKFNLKKPERKAAKAEKIKKGPSIKDVVTDPAIQGFLARNPEAVTYTEDGAVVNMYGQEITFDAEGHVTLANGRPVVEATSAGIISATGLNKETKVLYGQEWDKFVYDIVSYVMPDELHKQMGNSEDIAHIQTLIRQLKLDQAPGVAKAYLDDIGLTRGGQIVPGKLEALRVALRDNAQGDFGSIEDVDVAGLIEEE